MKEGVYLRDVDFKVPDLDIANASAVTLTGAWPAYTGVPAAMVVNPENSTLTPVLAVTSGTSLTNDSFTPENLRLSTVADEYAIAKEGGAIIYSVATDPQQAVILAGHAANNAIWLNNTSGLWSSSSYYGGLPSAITRYNIRSSLPSRIDTITWRPLQATRTLDYLNKPGKQLFSYKFNQNDRDVYRKFAASPAGNAEVTDLVIKLISELPPQSDGMINIGYTLAPYRYTLSDTRAETADAYIRLDAQIARIIEAADRYCGKGNALIWITSTGHFDAATVTDKRYRIPGGEFSIRRAKSLLNSYLAARHGNADYISAFRNGNVFLNHKVIETMHLDPQQVTDDARLFLARMSGVANTYSARHIISGTSPHLYNRSLGYDPKLCADIIVEFMPGWTVNDEEAFSVTLSSQQVPVMTPAFIMGAGLTPQTIDYTVDATAIAPTIAGLLRIRAPNGSSSRPLPLK